jgi:hypothetical protein
LESPRTRQALTSDEGTVAGDETASPVTVVLIAGVVGCIAALRVVS